MAISSISRRVSLMPLLAFVIVLTVTQTVDACWCRRNRQCVVASAPYQTAVPTGRTRDSCSVGRVIYRSSIGNIQVSRGQTVDVPVLRTWTQLFWYCTGSKDDETDIPYGTDFVRVIWYSGVDYFDEIFYTYR